MDPEKQHEKVLSLTNTKIQATNSNFLFTKTISLGNDQYNVAAVSGGEDEQYIRAHSNDGHLDSSRLSCKPLPHRILNGRILNPSVV